MSIFQELDCWLRARSRFFWQFFSSETRQLQSKWLGPAGEREAARFLQRLGYRILARSHRQRLGEIDLIALDGQCLVFVEVKAWASDSSGDPSLAVDTRKQERLSRAALIFMKKHKLLENPARFDVISIVWPAIRGAKPSIRHFKSAFEAIGRGQFFR